MTLSTLEQITGPHPNATLIMLHGLGADGSDFSALVQELALQAIGDVRFVFPNAPHRPVTVNGGYVMPAWYDMAQSDLLQSEDEVGMRRSQQSIAALIDRERERGIAASRIVLAGFSQGCAMALMTGLRYPHRLAGIVGLSGYLPLASRTPHERHSANRAARIFLGHGQQDPVVPMAAGLQSQDFLVAQGDQVQWRTYPMAHSVCAQELRDLNGWLLQVWQ